MPKPPMNDFVYILSPNGQQDEYGRDAFNATKSKARVKYASSLHINPDGEEFKNTIVVNLPPETIVQDNDHLRWIDRFGVTVEGSIEGIEETQNYSGKMVYYRTIYVNKKPVGFRFG